MEMTFTCPEDCHVDRPCDVCGSNVEHIGHRTLGKEVVWNTPVAAYARCIGCGFVSLQRDV